MRKFARIGEKFENINHIMMKKLYSMPAVRVGGIALERAFLASATAGGITPGADPGTGGSWEFGDED